MVCMMTSESVVSPGMDADTLDLANQQMEKLARATPEQILDTTTLLLDNNLLTRLDNIHTFQCLEKLSVSNNRVVRMFQVSKLQHLKVLDLSHNSLVTIEGLKDIKLLTWLSLAHNNIRNIENLNQNVRLEHLDMSHNQITYVSNVANLKNLKTLMLHNNKIGTLRSFTEYVPGCVTTLTLSDNQILELVDVSHLSHLSKLDQLTFANNPCIVQPQDPQKQFDHRPYVINWCLSLRMLDGVLVGAKESLKAEWMYSQSKGRSFGPGEQDSLVQYLVQTCPLDPTQETEQDKKLSLILSKVQEHQSSLRNPRAANEGFSTLPRSHSTENKKSAPSTPRRNSTGPINAITNSTPSSACNTPVNTPGVTRRNSTGRYGSGGRSRNFTPSPSSMRRLTNTPSQYNLELPPTLYGEDVVNGNNLMTQSMDPAFLSTRLDNNREPESGGLMSQSVDASILRDNLNDRFGLTDMTSPVGMVTGSCKSAGTPPARPRSLFSSRASGLETSLRSDDQLEVVELSDSECSSILGPVSSGGSVPPLYSRLQSRLNPVPESLNSPDIVPGPSPPRRDDPLQAGPLSNLPHDLELRLKNGNIYSQAKSEAAHSSSTASSVAASPRSQGNNHSPRPSDLMVAAVTARTQAPKTPNHQIITRPTSAVKPTNVQSKVDSGLSRGGTGRIPIPRSRSQSAGPVRKNSLPNRQVAALRSACSTASATPETTRKRTQANPLSLADDEASDTENELRNDGEDSPPGQPKMHKSRKSASHNGGLENPANGSASGAAKTVNYHGFNNNNNHNNNNNLNNFNNRTNLRHSGEVSSGGQAGKTTRRSGSAGTARRDDSRDGVTGQQRTNRYGHRITNGPSDHMTKSVSSVQVSSSASSIRPRSTSLTRSQSARLGKGGTSSISTSQDRSSIQRPRSSTLSTPVTSRGSEANNAARSVQSSWRGHYARNKDPQVREVKEELRTMRLEAHVKQLSKELKNAKAALEQERKLRKVQSDTIKVLWKEIQSMQMEEEFDYLHLDPIARMELQKGLSRKCQQRIERKMSRFLSGRQDDSDSSRGEEQLYDLGGSGSSTSGVEDKSVADLNRTCSKLQSQVELLQSNLASVVRFVSQQQSQNTRSRHSSSSTPPPHQQTGHLPNSMTMSLPTSLILPNPVTISRSCDSLAQTDIVAVKTPQTEAFPFFKTRQAFTDVDTSDSDLTRLDIDNLTTISTTPPSHNNVMAESVGGLFPPNISSTSTAEASVGAGRSRSPRPHTLPGVTDGSPATVKKPPPPGSHIPGMPEQATPPGPKIVRMFANSLAQGILTSTASQISHADSTAKSDTAGSSRPTNDRSEKSSGQSEKPNDSGSANRKTGSDVGHSKDAKDSQTKADEEDDKDSDDMCVTPSPSL